MAEILVVEPDHKIRIKFFDILSQLGHKVSSVPTGKELLLRLTEERPQVIILAQNIPDMDAKEAIEKIREFDKEAGIVLLTDHNPQQGEYEGIDIQAVVKKDFSTHFMMRKILEINKEREGLRLKEIPSKKDANILIVDDNPEIRNVLWAFLDKKGYKVSTASSGEEALLKIKESLMGLDSEKFKIVLLDIRMPGLDSLAALEKIKELDPSIKVVMLTSAQDKYIVDEARRLGSSDYLVKPCDFNQLDAVIASLLLQG